MATFSEQAAAIFNWAIDDDIIDAHRVPENTVNYQYGDMVDLESGSPTIANNEMKMVKKKKTSIKAKPPKQDKMTKKRKPKWKAAESKTDDRESVLDDRDKEVLPKKSIYKKRDEK